MAEKVRYKGGQLDGIEITNAASEATLLLILEQLEKTGVPGSSKERTELRIRDLFNRRIKDNTRWFERHTREVKHSTNAFKAIGSAFGVVGGTLTKAATSASSMMLNFSNKAVDSFRLLSSQGIDLGNSVFSAMRGAAEAELEIELFVKAMQRGSIELGMMSGSASVGAQAFLDISKNMKRSGVHTQLMRLGMSMEEIAEGTLDYLILQTRLGKAQTMDTKELTVGSQKYLFELDKLSRATGISRKQISESMQAAANDDRLRAMIMAKGEVGKEMAQFVGVIKSVSPEISEAIVDSMVNFGNATTDSGKSLKLASDSFYMLGHKVASGALTAEEALAQMANHIPDIDEATAHLAGRLQQMGVAVNPLVIKGILQQFRNYNKEMAKTQADQMAAMEAQDKIFGAFTQMLTSVKTKLFLTFIDTGLPDAFATAVGTLGKHLSDYIVKLDFGPITDAFREGDWKGVVDELKKIYFKVSADFKVILQKFVQHAFGHKNLDETKAAVLNGIKEMMTAFTDPIKDAIVSGIQNAALIAGSALAAIFVSGKFLDAVMGGGNSRGGPGLPDIGRGNQGGALTSIANGIAAFANPKVAMGAAVFGAAVAAVGAGVAGATWIVGKSLPSLASGLESFQNLDGKALKAAGDGVQALGAGIATLGAGSFVKALSIPAEAFNNFMESFGISSDPFAKLSELGKIQIDTDNMTKNAEAIAAFSKSLQSMGALSFKSLNIKEYMNVSETSRSTTRLAASYDKLAVSMTKVGNVSTSEFNSVMKSISEGSYNAGALADHANAIAAFSKSLQSIGALSLKALDINEYIDVRSSIRASNNLATAYDNLAVSMTKVGNVSTGEFNKVMKSISEGSYNAGALADHANAIAAFSKSLQSIGAISLKALDINEYIDVRSSIRASNNLATAYDKLAVSLSKLGKVDVNGLPGLPVQSPTLSTAAVNQAVSTTNNDSSKTLLEIKEALQGLRNDLTALEPEDNTPLVNSNNTQVKQLTELLENIKILNASIKDMLLVQRKVHDIDRKQLTAIRQNSDYM